VVWAGGAVRPAVSQWCVRGSSGGLDVLLSNDNDNDNDKSGTMSDTTSGSMRAAVGVLLVCRVCT
jgi:hypothetical protein